MNPAKELQKNWLLPNNKMYCFSFKNKMGFLLILFFSFKFSNAQIANYVSNGGFEALYTCTVQLLENTAKSWMTVDSTKHCAFVYNKCNNGVPVTGVGYQMPRSGNGYIRLQLYYPNPIPPNNFTRSNIKNRLKQNLQAGKTYCVKMYVSVQDICPNAIDGFGFYFGDNTLDTIIYNSRLPLTFLTPQVSNPTGNIINDTMNWVPVTGTFVANGNEKYMVVANFKSEASTNFAISNSNVSGSYSEYFVDDVSCIDINLPAFAGGDIWGIPNTTVYLGRPQDVGIDEACMWYKLPNFTTAIDTAAGITLTVGVVTNTYVVKQDICGNVKWDTVVIYPSGVGLNEGEYIKNNISIYPNPASDVLNIEFNHIQDANFKTVLIYNTLGELIHEEELLLKNSVASFHTNELPNGVYYLFLKSDRSINVSKRFVVTKQ